MRTDDEALEYLKRRGLEPGVVAIIRALLKAQPVQFPGSVGAVVSAAGRDRRERDSRQNQCVLAAIKLIYPAGVPPDILAAKLAREVTDKIQRSAGQPWHISVHEDTVNSRVEQYLAKLRA